MGVAVWAMSESSRDWMWLACTGLAFWGWLWADSVEPVDVISWQESEEKEEDVTKIILTFKTIYTVYIHKYSSITVHNEY
jgi:hypothetical protein